MIIVSPTLRRAARTVLLGLRWTFLVVIILVSVLLAIGTAEVMFGAGRTAVLVRKSISLYWRSPEREAAAAARLGDFRLGLTRSFGPSSVSSSLPGVHCNLWRSIANTKLLSISDNWQPGDSLHGAAARRFLTRYNQALVGNPAFPYPELCARDGAKPVTRYVGSVRDFAEAARAGDIEAVGRLGAAHVADVNARDMLGYTALQWTLRDEHRNVAIALLRLGADPNLRAPDRSGNTEFGPVPLARAVLQRDDVLVHLLLASGAHMSGETGLCDRREQFPPDDYRCTWPGLVAGHGRFDLLPAALRADRGIDRDPLDPRFFTSGRYDLIGLFVDAAQKDELLARRLLPFVREDEPGDRVAWLLADRRPALAVAYARMHRYRLGSSRAEGKLWTAAADNGHADTLAFLADAGGELNLLPRKRLAGCRASAASGRTMALIGCVKEAASREAAIESRIHAGDTRGLSRLLNDAADLHVHGRADVADCIIRFGTPAMVRTTLPLLAPLNGAGNPWRAGDTHGGPALVRLSRWQGYRALQARLSAGSAPLALALARQDASIVEAVAKAHPNDFEAQSDMLLNPVSSGFAEQTGEQTVSKSPPEPKRTYALILIRQAGRAGDQLALERMLQAAVLGGWDELSRAILNAGFNGHHARRPDRLWHNWSDLGSPCLPSTGVLLVHAGVP